MYGCSCFRTCLDTSLTYMDKMRHVLNTVIHIMFCLYLIINRFNVKKAFHSICDSLHAMCANFCYYWFAYETSVILQSRQFKGQYLFKSLRHQWQQCLWGTYTTQPDVRGDLNITLIWDCWKGIPKTWNKFKIEMNSLQSGALFLYFNSWWIWFFKQKA